MEANVLSLEKVSKHFGSEQALNQVSLTVRKGDIYGLIGRNGSGKTTIMKLITDLSTMSKGKITLLGKAKGTKNYHLALQRIGTVIEAPVAFNKLSAYENMKIICIQKGIHDYSIIQEMLEFVNLENTGKKKFQNFSLGMKQRLGIAMALVNNPDFLILDEPINGLDPIAIIEFRELLEKINREKNTTILISSHILSELYQVSTRFGFIHQGEMIQEITKQEFDSMCTEAIVVKVQNVAQAAVILKEAIGDQFQVVQGNEIHISDQQSTVASINQMLTASGILIDYIGKKESNLENYYTNLIQQFGGISS